MVSTRSCSCARVTMSRTSLCTSLTHRKGSPPRPRPPRSSRPATIEAARQVTGVQVNRQRHRAHHHRALHPLHCITHTNARVRAEQQAAELALLTVEPHQVAAPLQVVHDPLDGLLDIPLVCDGRSRRLSRHQMVTCDARVYSQLTMMCSASTPPPIGSGCRPVS